MSSISVKQALDKLFYGNSSPQEIFVSKLVFKELVEELSNIQRFVVNGPIGDYKFSNWAPLYYRNIKIITEGMKPEVLSD